MIKKTIQFFTAVGRLFHQTYLKFQKENIGWMAAALAYYTLFSIAPTFIIVVAIGGRFFGKDVVVEQIAAKIGTVVGPKSAEAIARMVEAGQDLTAFTPANLVSGLVLLYVATNVFAELKNTMNEMWDVPPANINWVKNFLLDRLLSILMIGIIGLLLLSLVIVEILLSVFDQILTALLPIMNQMLTWKLINFGISFLVITLIFAFIYRVLPDARIIWKDVWPGALIASFLFNIGKAFMAMYLGNSQTLNLFGAASSLVIILIWVYYSAYLVLLGAAFSKNYAVEFGSWKGLEEVESSSGIRKLLPLGRRMKKRQEFREKTEKPTGKP